jgi:hypothetical protein
LIKGLVVCPKEAWVGLDLLPQGVGFRVVNYFSVLANLDTEEENAETVEETFFGDVRGVVGTLNE